jgi:hypothetical protein
MGIECHKAWGVMILLVGQSQYATIERLVPELDTKSLNWIDSLESNGFTFVLNVLPYHINTPECYAMILLDQFLEKNLPQGGATN